MSLDDLYKETILDHYQHPRNRGRLESPHPAAVRVVEEHDEEHQEADDDGDAADEHALGHRALGSVGEEQHVSEDHRADDDQRQP